MGHRVALGVVGQQRGVKGVKSYAIGGVGGRKRWKSMGEEHDVSRKGFLFYSLIYRRGKCLHLYNDKTLIILSNSTSIVSLAVTTVLLWS